MDSIEIIEWQALEYEHREKSSDWLWTVGVIGVVLIVLAILFKNFLFAILLLIGTFAVLLYAARPPQHVDFALSPKGIKVKNRVYLYRHLTSFWVIDDPADRRKIIVESEKVLLPHMVLPLPEHLEPESIRDYLRQHLPEVHHDEPLTDVVAEYFGF